MRVFKFNFFFEILYYFVLPNYVFIYTPCMFKRESRLDIQIYS